MLDSPELTVKKVREVKIWKLQKVITKTFEAAPAIVRVQLSSLVHLLLEVVSRKAQQTSLPGSSHKRESYNLLYLKLGSPKLTIIRLSLNLSNT